MRNKRARELRTETAEPYQGHRRRYRDAKKGWSQRNVERREPIRRKAWGKE